MSRQTFVDRRLALVLACAALLLAPVRAVAQDDGPDRRWRVMPVVGATLYDDASALKNAPFFGGEAMYPVTSAFSVGWMLSFARPEVDGSKFPYALFQISADSLILYQVGQQTTQVSTGAMASLGTDVGRARVYVQGGVGLYSFFLDPQAISSLKKVGGEDWFTGLMIPAGAGLSLRVGDRSAIRLDFRDEIFTSFDRSRLHPVEPRFYNDCSNHHQDLVVCFPELNPASSSTSSDVIHNLRFSLGFELIPGF